MLKNVDSYLNNAVKNSFFMLPATKKYVEDILGILKTYKSIDPCSIPTSVLREFKK